MADEAELRKQRMETERRLGILIKELQEWYTEWVKPNATEAKMATPGGKHKGETKVLPLKLADALDPSTPTARFERGRSHMEACQTEIRALRTQQAKLTSEIDSLAKIRTRRARPNYAQQLRSRVLGQLSWL